MKENSKFICFENVSKWFDTPAGRFNALKNINLEIAKGEYVAVVGKSGSGKSTLLNMLTGIDHPDQGMVSAGSVRLMGLNESQLARWRGSNVGIVFQFFQLIPTLTILENILIAMDFAGKIPKKERKERAVNLLKQVDIEDHKDKYPAALSGGQQQRAAIARALANDPPVIVADEPTGNLDLKTSEAVLQIFDDLVSMGKTVVVVTHEKTNAINFHRILSLSDGEMVSDNPGK